MKTIVYILPDKDAGVASVVRNLLRFKTSSCATKVILLHDINDPEGHRISSPLNADAVIRLSFNEKWSSKYSILKKIKRELDSNSILVSNDGSVELDVIGFFCLKIPVVYIMHGDYGHYYNVVNYKRSCISQIITVSHYIETKLSSKFNDIMVSSIKFPVPDVVLKNKVPSKTIRLVFVGSLTKIKGVYDLIDIVKVLELSKIDYSLNIIGDGPESKNLQGELVHFSRVQFFGHLPNQEVLAMHNEHDIILLPSKNEGLPVVIVEAMKCGVVPIVSDIKSGIPELVSHKDNGYRVALNEISKCSDYVIELASDRAKLKVMSDLCIKKANELFNSKRQTKAYEAAFLAAKANSYRMPFKKRIAYYIPSNLLRVLKK